MFPRFGFRPVDQKQVHNEFKWFRHEDDGRRDELVPWSHICIRQAQGKNCIMKRKRYQSNQGVALFLMDCLHGFHLYFFPLYFMFSLSHQNQTGTTKPLLARRCRILSPLLVTKINYLYIFYEKNLNKKKLKRLLKYSKLSDRVNRRYQLIKI